ncbi:MAG: hypothetical protein Q9184_008249 [Pyrenodesmia sp. 2 TL-2023]
MFSTAFLLLLLPLLLFLKNTHAVTITISPAAIPHPDVPPGQPNPGIIPYSTQRCPDIPPGVCCIPRRPPSPPAQITLDRRIKFEGLEALDIAAAWVPHEGKKACDGKVGASYTGGGTWIYEIPADTPGLEIAAGSYMRMPVGVPKEEDVGWMQGEGVLGFVTGKGDWWSKDVDKAKVLDAAARYGFGSLAGKGLPWAQKVKRLGKRVVDMGKMGMTPHEGLEKRGIRSADKGWVLCRGPRKGIYPDVMIDVDGVEYRAETPQAAVYISGEGKVLNFTEPAT